MTEKLEELLRELIKRGREPRGKKYSHLNCDPKRKHRHIMLVGDDIPVFSYSLRQLVSLESGLWQFCAEKELTKSETSEYLIKRYIKQLITRKEGDVLEGEVLGSDLDYEYWLLSSALVPEEELVKFLLDNIIVEGNSK